MRLRPRLALLVTLTLLVALLGWWSVLLFRLTTESYEQSVGLVGEAATATLQLERRRAMIAGESATLLGITVLLLFLGWRSSVVEARQAQRLRVLFAASTHELKTPIAGLRALLESLASGVLPLEQAGAHLDRGLDACRRLERLAEGMLVRQAVLAGESPAEVRTVRQWVDPVVAARPAGQALEVELGAAGPLLVRLPGEAMRVILDNLLDNAARYAAGSVVRLTAAREAGLLRVRVSDQGSGFAPGDADRLFEPWERGRQAGTANGTGLGLYLARSIAQEAGGDVTATSDGLGRGATFTATFPVCQP